SGTIALTKEDRYIKFYTKAHTGWNPNNSGYELNAATSVSKTITTDKPSRTLAMGNKTIGDYVEQTIVINWEAQLGANLVLSSSHPDYTIQNVSNNIISLTPGNKGSRNVLLRYKPSTEGASSASLTITEQNYADNKEVVLLSGTGLGHTPPVLSAATNKTNTGFDIAWSAVNFADAYEFDLYKKENGNKVYVGIYQNYQTATNRSFHFTGLDPDQIYYIVVRSKNATYKSANSNEVEIAVESYFTITLGNANPEMGNINTIGWKKKGSSVNAIATAKANCAFVAWKENGHIVSTNPTYTFEVTQDRNLTASFVSTLKEVAAKIEPMEAGVVEGTGLFNIGQSVCLTANANYGYHFLYWRNSGGTQITTDTFYNLNVVDNVTYYAYFGKNTYTLNITSNNGTVEGGGSYLYGDQVNLHASPEPYYVFESYTENGTVLSTDPNFSFVLTAHRNLVANYRHKGFVVKVEKTPNEGGTVSGGGIIALGQNALVKAEAAPNFNFSAWYDSAQVKSTQANYTFTPTADLTLNARFAYANEKSLPHTFATDENFSSNKTVTYHFTEVPGKFHYIFDKSGAYNAWCKSNLKIEVSSDNVNYTALEDRNNDWSFTSDKILDKTIRYIRITFDKCGTNAAQAFFKASSYIHKSIDCNVDSWDFGTKVLGDSIDKNITVSWASNVSNNLLLSTTHPDITILGNSEIEVQPGFAGSKVISLRYKAQSIGALNADLRIKEKNYETNTDIVSLHAKSIAQTPPVLQAATNLQNTGFEIAWTPSNFVQTYEFDLYQKQGETKVPVGSYQSYSTKNNCNFSFSNLTPDQTYYMVVRGVYNDIRTNNSNEIAITLESYFMVQLQNANPEMGTINSVGMTKINTEITALASVKPNCAFVAWKSNGQILSTQLAYTFNVTSDTLLTAFFISTLKEVATLAEPLVGGTIQGGGLYTIGDPITLIATPTIGYTFSHWSKDKESQILSKDSIYSFALKTDALYKAHFSIKKYYVDILMADHGTVEGEAFYNYGDSVHLIATPINKYYVFDNYTENGIVVSTQPSYSFVATQNRELVANFSHRGYDVLVYANPEEGGTVSGTKTYQEGQTATLTATPSNLFKFAAWYSGTELLSTSPTLSFVPNKDTIIQARFSFENEISLPYYFPSDIKFSGGDKTLTYYFHDVPGRFYYNFVGGGSYNAICKSNFTISTSVNGLNDWTTIYHTQQNFTFAGSVVLDKTVRYLRFSFEKCGTNDQTITLKNNSYILKSINAQPDVMDFAEVLLHQGQTYEMNVNWAENISGINGNIQLDCPNPDFKFSMNQIPTANGIAASERIRITYMPDTLGSDLATLRIYDKAYPANEELIILKGKGIDKHYKVFTTVHDSLGIEDPTKGEILGNTQYDYVNWTPLSLEAKPAEGYHLVAWKENDTLLSYDPILNITVCNERHIQAYFAKNTYINQICSDKGGYAKFSSKLLGEDYYSSHGEMIEIEATPDFGYHFIDYITKPYNNLFSTEINYIYKSTQDRNILARFDTNTYAIFVKSKDTLWGTASQFGDSTKEGTYKHFTQHRIVATPAPYCRFLYWEDVLGN
ncbi:MAG: hypothetical protein RR190_02195, partial [Bacteroidales bacterium]